MKEHQFNSNVEKIYISLSNEEKVKYKKQQDKFNICSLAEGVLLIMICVTIAGGFFYFIGNNYIYSILTGIVLLLCFCGISIWIIKPGVIGLKSNDETKIKMCIERLEKQKEQLNNFEKERTACKDTRRKIPKRRIL